MKRAMVALARKLATALHRMRMDGRGFRFRKQEGLAAAVQPGKSGALPKRNDEAIPVEIASLRSQ
jgi:hypothetical protein